MKISNFFSFSCMILAMTLVACNSSKVTQNKTEIKPVEEPIAEENTFEYAKGEHPGYMYDENGDSIEVQLDGAYVDEHGCRPSAGASWSILMQECVRFWEVGSTLRDARDENASLATRLIRVDGKSDVEISVPGVRKPFLMAQVEEGWKDASGDFLLKETSPGFYELYNKAGELIFVSEEK